MVFTNSFSLLASTLGTGMVVGGTFTTTFFILSTSTIFTLGFVSAGVFTMALLSGLVVIALVVTGFLVTVDFCGLVLGVVFTIAGLLAMVSTFLISGFFSAGFCFSFSL